MPCEDLAGRVGDRHHVEVADDQLTVIDDRRGCGGLGGDIDGIHACGTGSVVVGRSATGRDAGWMGSGW